MDDLMTELFDGMPEIRYVAVYRNGSLTTRQRPDLSDALAAGSDRYEELLVNPTLLTNLHNSSRVPIQSTIILPHPGASLPARCRAGPIDDDPQMRGWLVEQLSVGLGRAGRRDHVGDQRLRVQTSILDAGEDPHRTRGDRISRAGAVERDLPLPAAAQGEKLIEDRTYDVGRQDLGVVSPGRADQRYLAVARRAG